MFSINQKPKKDIFWSPCRNTGCKNTILLSPFAPDADISVCRASNLFCATCATQYDPRFWSTYRMSGVCDDLVVRNSSGEQLRVLPFNYYPEYYTIAQLAKCVCLQYGIAGDHQLVLESDLNVCIEPNRQLLSFSSVGRPAWCLIPVDAARSVQCPPAGPMTPQELASGFDESTFTFFSLGVDAHIDHGEECMSPEHVAEDAMKCVDEEQSRGALRLSFVDEEAAMEVPQKFPSPMVAGKAPLYQLACEAAEAKPAWQITVEEEEEEEGNQAPDLFRDVASIGTIATKGGLTSGTKKRERERKQTIAPIKASLRDRGFTVRSIKDTIRLFRSAWVDLQSHIACDANGEHHFLVLLLDDSAVAEIPEEHVIGPFQDGHLVTVPCNGDYDAAADLQEEFYKTETLQCLLSLYPPAEQKKARMHPLLNYFREWLRMEPTMAEKLCTYFCDSVGDFIFTTSGDYLLVRVPKGMSDMGSIDFDERYSLVVIHSSGAYAMSELVQQLGNEGDLLEARVLSTKFLLQNACVKN